MKLSSYILILVLAFGAFGCASSSKYMVVVVDQHGLPLKEAWVTPVALGKNFDTHVTDIDGQADLKGSYTPKPYKIHVQRSGYKSAAVDWELPSVAPLEIRLQRQ